MSSSSSSAAQNWYEIPVVIPEKYKNWVAENVPAEDVKEIPSPHITILYGFDPKHYADIDAIVKDHKITEKDYSFDPPKKGSLSPVWLLPLKSDKLQTLFHILYAVFPNEHTLFDGKYEPHVTLCWLKTEKQQ